MSRTDPKHNPPSGPSHQDDRIGELIRLAGQRSTVHDLRAARVKKAVHAHWKEGVRQRSRRRTFRLGLGLAAAAVLVVGVLGIVNWSSLSPPEPATLIRVEAVKHPVWIRSQALDRRVAPEILGVGTAIPIGSEVATEGDGRLALRLFSGVSVRLDVGTRARILSDSALYLDRGVVYVDAGRRDEPFEPLVAIQTSSGVIRDFGTQFEVRKATDSLLVRVREGRVVLEKDQDSYEVGVGTELEMASDGVPTRRDISVWGPEWEWLSEITPPVVLDGLSLDSFLGWYTRERGWQLHFEDDRLASSASEIMLSGSMEGLSLNEALSAVLVTSQMAYRMERGVLFIAAHPAAVRNE